MSRKYPFIHSFIYEVPLGIVFLLGKSLILKAKSLSVACGNNRIVYYISLASTHYSTTCLPYAHPAAFDILAKSQFSQSNVVFMSTIDL